MGTQDLLSLFKINILRNIKIWFLVTICFIVLVSYSRNLPQDFKDFLLDPFNIVILPLSIITVILLQGIFKIFVNLSKGGNKYSFTLRSWNEDWIYNGKTKILLDPVRLKINSSRAGCLLEKYLWNNFSMNFQMKFLYHEQNEQNLGIIFRAVDLENYFMLEIIRKTSAICVKPHVRYLGMWEIMSQDVIGEVDPSQEWLKIYVTVNRTEVKISIKGVGEYEWFLPTHVDINHIEDGPRKNNSNEFDEKEVAAKITLLPKIEFRKSFGMVGFRAHLNQGAEIKNLNISKI
ncbi:hypothetical protein HY404_01840 [Candidatus Microgenomates bacterium]|nr:hypothetical protein [Candidatus Microgenomates bacterium]